MLGALMDNIKNKRKALRRRTLKGVLVSFNDGFSAVEGVLKNMSEAGGLLVVKDGMIVPNTFYLYCELDGWKVECEVKRRQNNNIGFQYVSEFEQFKPTRHQMVSVINLNDIEPGQENSGEQNPEAMPVRLQRPVQKVFGKLGS